MVLGGMDKFHPRMSMITLGVADMHRSIRFYEQGLGFPRHGEGDDVAFFSLNGTWLGLYPRNELADDAQVDSSGTGFRGVSISYNLDSKSDVDSAMKLALAAGAKLVKKPQDVFWGGYSGYFSDPDGHLWEIAHNPFTWIGPSDE